MDIHWQTGKKKKKAIALQRTCSFSPFDPFLCSPPVVMCLSQIMRSPVEMHESTRTLKWLLLKQH